MAYKLKNSLLRYSYSFRVKGLSKALFTLIIFLALITFSFSDLAFSDDADRELSDDGDAVEEEVVVTADRINEKLNDPPVFVDIIEMKDFKGRFVTAKDVINQASGVTVKDFGGLGKMSTVSIRGSGSDHVVVMIDGVRVNSATGGGFDLSSIPVDQIERIEVIRGGDSAFYGDGAVGGVINIITRKSKEIPVTSVGANYGSFNTFNTHLSRSHGFDKGGYMVGASYMHTDGAYLYKSDNGTALDDSDDFVTLRKNNGADNRSILLKGNYSFSPNFDLAGQTDLYNSIKGMPGMITFPSFDAWQEELRNLSQINATVTGLPVRGLTFKTALSHRYNELAFSDRQGEQTGIAIDARYVEYEPRISQMVQYIWGTHQILTLQGEFLRTMLREKDEVYNNPERDRWALSVRDQIILWGDRITFVPALRFDSISDVGQKLSPKLGTYFRPINWLVFKGNAGQSFRAPNFSELYFNQGLVQGNPDLEPEVAMNYDAGLQIVTRPFFAEAAYFRTDVENLIEYLLVSGFRYKPFNIGRAKIEGMEAKATINPWEYTSLTGSFTMTYAIDQTGIENRDGNQLPGRPRYKAFGRLEAGPTFITAFCEYTYFGANFITQANTKLLDARNILNAGVVVHPSETFHFGIEVKNVLDDMAVDVRGFPLPGRSVFASVEMSF